MRISDWSSDVCSSDLFRDLEALDRETREALADGFTAKAAIHPAQIPVINAALTPDAEQIAWAEAVLAALDGKGAGRLEGRMVRSEEHTSELQSLMRNSYDGFCLKTKTKQPTLTTKVSSQRTHQN